MTERTLIFIPTYNESENIKPLYLEIKNLNLNADILFLDDNSPDGTGEIMSEICQQDQHAYFLHRKEKMGIGSAHKTGIAWAYAEGYHKLITMDADFTHSPKYIPLLLAKLDQNDVVVGSRYLKKDSLNEWKFFRKILTYTAHFLISNLLKFPYDSTNAFRAYRLSSISKEDLLNVKSNSYSFFFESLHKLHFKRYKISEIPIDLPARATGSSKMSYVDGFKSLYFLLKLYKERV